MTYAFLKTLLAQLLPATFESVAPAGLTRFIVCQRYGLSPVYAGDANVWDFPRVQIDVYTRDPEDPLPDHVRELLRAWCAPYSVQAMTYDDETALYRTILQLEVIS